MKKLQKMTPDKIAPLAVYLASDAAADINGQVFASRMNETMVLSQPRPVRSVHHDGGWTTESLAEHGMPALRAALVPLERTQDVFAWDPV